MRSRHLAVLFLSIVSALLISAHADLHAAALAPSPATVPNTVGWYQIPSSQLRSVCPPDNFGGSGYAFTSRCNGVMDAWNGGVFDTLRNRLIMWGGGHADYSGNEIYALDLNSLLLTRLTDPGLPLASACPESIVNDTQPNSRHTYGGIQYLPGLDKMFVFGGSLATCGYMNSGTWMFNFANNQWEKKNPTGSIPRADAGIVSAYDPNSGKVFLHDSLDLYSYTPSSNSYQKLSNNGTGIDYHMSAAIDPVRKKFVVLGGGQAWVYDIGGSTFTKQTLSASGGAAIIDSNYPGMVYSSGRDRIVAWSGGDTVYELNVGANTWTQTAFSGGPAAGMTGVFGHWQYSPASDAFVTVNDANQNAYTLRMGSAPLTSFDFSLTNMGNQTVVQGQSVTNTITTSLLSGTAQGVSFSASGLPANASAAFSAPSCTPACSSTLTLTASPSTPAGSSTITVAAVGGSVTHTTTFTWTVSATASPSFDFSLSNGGNRTVVQGQSASNTINAMLVSGTAQAVAFSVSGLPANSTAAFSPASCSSACSSTLTLTTSVSTPTGSSTLTVTGVGGSLSRTTTFTLTVSSTTTPPPPTGSITSFQLTSGINGTLPFTVGLGFKKGDLAGFPVLNVAASQVIVKSRWPDNSVKHAVASGRVALTAGTPGTLNVSSAGSAPAGTNLTASDIQAANPSASVQLGSYGTVGLSSLLGSPFRTWISGPEMVEAHYRSSVGSDPTLAVWFYVRLYKGGQTWIRAVVENGSLDLANAEKSYVPDVLIGGVSVYNNGGASLTQYEHTRWTAEGWIGSDPQVTPKLDTSYLIDAKLVPNYWKRNPSATALDNLYQDYIPMQRGGWPADMGSTGYAPQIGLLPNWDALYLTSGGDARAYQSVLANAKAINSFAIEWDDSATKLPTMPSNRPTWTTSGANGGGSTSIGAGSLRWDVAHHGSAGYLAYLITGDYYYLETLEDLASTCYLINTSSSNYDPDNGPGTSRLLKGQTRGVSWCNRTVGQLAGIGPTGDPIVADYRALLANNAAFWNSQVQKSGQNLLGILYSYELGSYGTGQISPWQQAFWVQTYGSVSDLEPLADMTAFNAVRNYLYKSAVGILGPGGAGNYCYTDAANYTIAVASGNDDTTNWFDTWGEVYQATFGSPSTSCGTTLTGTSGGDPGSAASGYWGNLMPAIAYAVDHGAAGAATAWNRLTSASNWSAVASSGFDNTPLWGIVPRSFNSVTPVPVSDITAPTVSTTAPTAGSALSAAVTVSATASDNVGISGVQFKLDGTNLGTEDATSPYSISWNTMTVLNGSYTLTALAKDAAGNQTTSATVTITVNNVVADTTPPTVSITAPLAGSSVSGASITVSANALDNLAVAGVQFKLDGANLSAEDTTSPYSVVWNASSASVGSHSLTAVARDTAGNQTSSGVVTVSIADTTPPALSGVGSSNIASTSATISWITNEAADSQVEYGLSTTYGSQSTLDSTRVTSHSQTLSGITAGTTYNYRVKSRDAAGNPAVSANFTFTTSAATTGRTINIYPGTDVFKAAAETLLPGDTLVVHQGLYTENNRISIQGSGTSSAPIIITGASGEAMPIITRSATAAVQNTINIEGSATNLTIRGLEIIGNGGDGINMSGAVSFITLRDNVIHDIDVGINFRASMNNITVLHNHIYNTGIDGGTGEGMYVGCNDATCIVRDSLIEQNWIHDALPGTTQGDGIEVKFGSHSNIIRDNVIYNRPYPGIFVYGTLSNPVNIVEGNVVWNALEGIYAVSDAIVRNNIVFNSGTGLSLYGHSQVSQMKNVTAVSNTLYNNTDGIYMRWTSSAVNMVVANNAIYSPITRALNTAGSVGTFSANYVEGTADRTLDATAFINGGTSANAFVDPVNANFWLKAGSPLLNMASGGYAPATDFNRTPRVSPYDVGAYETGGAAANPGWTLTPGFKNNSTAAGDTTPATISGVAASSITANGAAINWSTNEASDSQIEYGTTTSYGSQTALAGSQVIAHSQAISGLSAGTTYNYRVKSRDAAGNLATSANFAFTTGPAPDTTAPSVTTVASAGITVNGATVSWSTNETSDSQVEYGTTTSYGSQTTLNSSLVSAHSQALSGLAAGTTYNFRVKSRDAAGNLATSGNFTFTTTAAADITPPTITGVTASGITASGATITWTTNEASDTQVDYGTTTSYGSQTTLNTSKLTAHSQTLTGLAAGVTYNYRVKSRDAAGNSGISGNFTLTTAAVSGGTGLIGFWSFNEGAGTTTIDASGMGNNGTLVNNPTWATGAMGGGLQFKASDNGNDNDDPRVVIGRNFDVASLPFTLSAWVKPEGFQDYRAIFSKRDGTSDSKIRFDVGLSKGGGNVYLYTGATKISFNAGPALNTWTHITVVATTSSTSLYVNGVLRQTVGAARLGSGAGANTVIGGTGEAAGGDNDPFKGSIDEVRVYNRSLSATEVQQIFASRLKP
jgi:hypothetical protein